MGSNPDWERHRGEAERLKGLLVGWLEEVNAPQLESVRARPIAAQTLPPRKKPGPRKAGPRKPLRPAKPLSP